MPPKKKIAALVKVQLQPGRPLLLRRWVPLSAPTA